MSTYYLDHDCHGDLTLWDGNQSPPKPVAVRHCCEGDVWNLLLLGAGLREACDGGWQYSASTHIEGCLVHDTTAQEATR